jgi:hypothetical protein
MANTLHFIQEQQALLRRLLSVADRFLIVEYPILLTTKLLQRTVPLVILVTEKLSCRSEIPREEVFRDHFHPHHHRIVSLDILRGLNVALMIFVNELAKVACLVDLSRSRQNRRDDVRGHGVPPASF